MPNGTLPHFQRIRGIRHTHRARHRRQTLGATPTWRPAIEVHSSLRWGFEDGQVIVLLAGGDKTTQATDIKTALRLARNL